MHSDEFQISQICIYDIRSKTYIALCRTLVDLVEGKENTSPDVCNSHDNSAKKFLLHKLLDCLKDPRFRHHGEPATVCLTKMSCLPR